MLNGATKGYAAAVPSSMTAVMIRAHSIPWLDTDPARRNGRDAPHDRGKPWR
jgi:hypothetical protein